ncbi:MAG: DUF1501 domain-containing protein [Acidobacteria bacterium]|nr:DUF1501 domain-containing protein [Acidobacteriota bacterium]
MRINNLLPSRRDFLSAMGSGFGMLGLAKVLAERGLLAADNPLAPKAPHFQPKAKHVIFLMMNGGLSQVDTFDPKPMLDKHHGMVLKGGNLKTERKTGALMRSPFKFHPCGQSGIQVSEIFPEIGKRIDDICVIRSMYTDIPNHEPSLMMMNCGENLMSRPSLGSWITYGLGTENQNLPGFVVLCPGAPVVGTPLWNSSFLPAVYQGTHILNNEKDPQKLIQYLQSSQETLDRQRRRLDLLESLNRRHSQARGNDSQLEASIQAMETAFRMQTEAPEALDIGQEKESTRARYRDSDFGRGCLMALRLVERGIRMVQIYYGNGQPWDNHDDILIHRKLAQDTDGPVAALLDDLKARGLFDETLVIFGSEFGRTPAVETSSLVNVQNGRDHNPYGFSIWLAGGGVKGGIAYGATDDFGFRAEQNRTHVHDLHATVLHLLGIDHTRLTYRYSGRDFRLTDVHGNVIKEILA